MHVCSLLNERARRRVKKGKTNDDYQSQQQQHHHRLPDVLCLLMATAVVSKFDLTGVRARGKILRLTVKISFTGLVRPCYR